MLYPHRSTAGLHVFILWQAEKNSDIKLFLNTISTRFDIRVVTRFHWSDEHWETNLTRLYRVLPAGPKLKVAEIGGKPLVAAVCKDPSPRYGFHKTLGDSIEHSNLNAIDCKRYLRSSLGGNYCHCSSTPQEYLHQSTLLFGHLIHENPEPVLLGPKIKDQHCDLVGANGWQNGSELFNMLNCCCNYIVLRNFELVPYDFQQEKDVDVLTEDIEHFAAAANAKPLDTTYCRYVATIAGKPIPFDIRCLGDGYYDSLWQKDMLMSKTFTEHGIPVPDDVNHFFSLLYHAKLHKSEVYDKYRRLLISLAERINYVEFSVQDIDDDKRAASILSGFMKARRYTIPASRCGPTLNREMLARTSGYYIPTKNVIWRRKLLNQLRARLPDGSYELVPQAIKALIKDYLNR